MQGQVDRLNSGRRFVLGKTPSNRLEVDFLNLYAWFLPYVAGKKVLDVACGSGLGSFLMAHKAKEVHGIDLSQESIEYAKNLYNLDNLTFLAQDIFSYQISDSSFDVVVCSLVLEQVEAHRQVDLLTKLGEILKPGGLIILVTPNKRVTSPSKPGGHEWNTREFNKLHLERLIRRTSLTILGWYGQRLVFFLYTNFFIRKGIGFLQKLLNKKLGFYGRRESPQVKPLKFYWEPRLFILLLTR